jgi:hypothetical protein
MDWQERFDAFGLHDQGSADNQINSITAIQQNVFITHRERHLHLKWDLAPAIAHTRDTAGKSILANPVPECDAPRSRIQ